MQLSQEQVEEIKHALFVNRSPVEIEIAKLIAIGMSKDEAVTLLRTLLKEHKQELFEATLQKQRKGETAKGGLLGVFIAAVVGPVFNIESFAWYFIACIGGGVCGYFANKDKPVAGVAGGCIAVLVFPFTYNAYFSGRHTFLNIELLIPMLLAAIPALLVYYIIAKVFYSNQ